MELVKQDLEMNLARDHRSRVCFGARIAIALEVSCLLAFWWFAFPAVGAWFNNIGASLPPLSAFFMRFHVAPVAVLVLIVGWLVGHAVPLRIRPWILVVVAIAGGMVLNAAVAALFPLLWGIARARGWAS